MFEAINPLRSKTTLEKKYVYVLSFISLNYIIIWNHIHNLYPKIISKLLCMRLHIHIPKLLSYETTCTLFGPKNHIQGVGHEVAQIMVYEITNKKVKPFNFYITFSTTSFELTQWNEIIKVRAWLSNTFN